MDKTKHSSRLQPTTDTYFFDKVRFSIALGHDYTLDAYWDVLRSSDARPCHDCSMSIAKGLPKTITFIKSKNYDKANYQPQEAYQPCTNKLRTATKEMTAAATAIAYNLDKSRFQLGQVSDLDKSRR